MNKEELIIGFFEKGYCCDLDEVKDTCLGLLKENQELKRQNEFLMKRDNKCQMLEQQYNDLVEEKESLQEQLSSKTLQLEQLKKQLEEYRVTNKILSQELTKDKVLQQDHLTTCCGIPIGDIPKLINQQKVFIEYLEDEKDRLARECSTIYEDSLGHTRLVNEDIFNEVNKILQEYKEIVNGTKRN